MQCQGCSWHIGIPVRRLNLSPLQRPDSLGTQPRILSLQIWISHLAILHSLTAVNGMANISCNITVLWGLWHRDVNINMALSIECSFRWKTRVGVHAWKQMSAQKKGQACSQSHSAALQKAPLQLNISSVPLSFCFCPGLSRYPIYWFLFAPSVVCKAHTWWELAETHCTVRTLTSLLRLVPEHVITRWFSFYSSVKQCLGQSATGKMRESRIHLQILEGIAKNSPLFFESGIFGF